MKSKIFVSIDFDGTITDSDITDEILKAFAKPEWEEVERQWEEGIIGSRECLSLQFSLIDSPIEKILRYADCFSPNKSFPSFIEFLRENKIPFAIISDGFDIFIRRILSNAGIEGVPLFANKVGNNGKGLKTIFPYMGKDCLFGICKCSVAKKLSNGSKIFHIGDGRSDFCLSEKVAYTFSKGKLTDYCKRKNIPHSSFKDFRDIKAVLEKYLKNSLELGEKDFISILQ